MAHNHPPTWSAAAWQSPALEPVNSYLDGIEDAARVLKDRDAYADARRANQDWKAAHPNARQEAVEKSDEWVRGNEEFQIWLCSGSTE